MAQKVVVFSQSDSMFCNRTKEFLSQKGISFEERDVSPHGQSTNVGPLVWLASYSNRLVIAKSIAR